jgi:hypothetical protein
VNTALDQLPAGYYSYTTPVLLSICFKMGSGGEKPKIMSSMPESLEKIEDKTSRAVGNLSSSLVSAWLLNMQRQGSRKKSRREGEPAAPFNAADDLISEDDAQEDKQPLEFVVYLSAEQKENARLKAEYKRLVNALLVKNDILKAMAAVKKLPAAAPTDPSPLYVHGLRPQEHEVSSAPNLSIKTSTWTAPDHASQGVIAAAAAAAGDCGEASSLLAAVPSSPNAAFTTTPTKSEAPQYHQQTSVSSEVDYSDFTSSMIVIRSHQGDLKSLLQEAEEEGLSTDLMASIESTVAETSKIYSDLMGQRREHPAITNSGCLLLAGDFSLPSEKPRRLDATKNSLTPNHRAIAKAILERLTQQNLMSLHNSWQAHSKKLELIQQKQSRLEIMRTSLASAIQQREADGKSEHVSWKARASAFLASEYLEKSTREAYWEEWDAIDKFEGTCCEVSRDFFLKITFFLFCRRHHRHECLYSLIVTLFLLQILGTYNTAIMYVESAPASPNCAAITKEVLALATQRGRLCLAT